VIATATKKVHASGSPDRTSPAPPDVASFELRSYLEDGGRYNLEIVIAADRTLLGDRWARLG
jgi:hypothetical protein